MTRLDELKREFIVDKLPPKFTLGERVRLSVRYAENGGTDTPIGATGTVVSISKMGPEYVHIVIDGRRGRSLWHTSFWDSIPVAKGPSTPEVR